MIPSRCRRKFRTYNSGKLVKYGMLVRVVSETSTGVPRNTTSTQQGNPYLDKSYHIYMDNYYNSVVRASAAQNKDLWKYLEE
ncbi:hypothetical protein PR048_012471 [Dryococelus australis]|uniref:Uncharacterized protein n=1 Tax=Dryococelus australis TaxID=614101 RepID=A0ABQ9HPH2_9NEOP|nr:hypothetical protein PR048_012471 [Dryococelus australis]